MIIEGGAMISLTKDARAPYRAIVGLAVSLTVGATVAYPLPAQAATVPYNMSCTIFGLPLGTITTDVTTSYTPEVLRPGDAVTLDVTTSKPAGVPLDVPVTGVNLTIPIPEQVDTSVPTTVALEGGNLVGTSSVSGTTITVALTGDTTAFSLEIPRLLITSTLEAGTEGQTINWMGPTSLDIAATVTIPLQIPCTAAADNQPVATAAIEPAA